MTGAFLKNDSCHRASFRLFAALAAMLCLSATRAESILVTDPPLTDMNPGRSLSELSDNRLSDRQPPTDFSTPEGIRSPPNPPNILLVIMDDIGVDKVNTYAADYEAEYEIDDPNRPETPNLDELAQAGLKFTNAWANPVCSPTRAGIFTGRHAYDTGIGTAIGAGPPDLAPADVTTIAELMHGDANGDGVSESTEEVEVGLFGKWHLGGESVSDSYRLDSPNELGLYAGNLHPVQHGWDYFAGSVAGSLNDPSSADGGYFDFLWSVQNAQNTLQFFDLPFEIPFARYSRETIYATEMEAYEALDWISDRAGRWFATVAFHAPHDPYDIVDSNGVDTTSEQCFNELGRSSSDTQKYAGIVSCLDTYLGELLHELDSTGQLSNTLLIVVGDNGTDEGVSEDAWNINGDIIADGKGTVYENGVRVPLIIVDGANIIFDEDGVLEASDETTDLVADPGREIDHLLHTVDLFATIADVVGVKPDPATFLDSVSFADTLTHVAASPSRDSVYTERFFEKRGAYEGQAATRFIQVEDDEATGISAGDYKLIFDVEVANNNVQTCTYTLFDLAWNRFEAFPSSGSGHPRRGALNEKPSFADELAKAMAAVPSGVNWFDPDECTSAIQAPGA